VQRLVAFFATGDSIVANNLVLSLYKHINAPEARMYLSRQLYEEALHVEFYLTLLDSYIPDMRERERAFSAIKNIPSIKAKADFCFRWTDSVQKLERIETRADRKRFLLNLIAFACAVEGLFFFAAFAYVYFMRSKGLLNGLASGTNWVFRDESMHMQFALEVVDAVRREEPELFDDALVADVHRMLTDAVECETLFAQDLLGQGVPGLSVSDMRPTSSSSQISASPTSASPRASARRTPSASWTCRTCRSSRTSSSVGSARTRSESPAR
jgi:ribonucleoside-diphosphate reductase beta chain